MNAQAMETINEIDTRLFSEEEREQFVNGWAEAGGYIDDMDAPFPWCCPWEYEPILEPEAVLTPYELGSWFWEYCREAVSEAIREEEAERAYLEEAEND